MRKISRRQFVALSAGALAAASAGCDPGKARADLRRWIGKPAAPLLEGPLTAPQSAELDDAAHLINRLTFGPRPGEHARVSALGAQAFIEEQLSPETIADWQCDRVVRHEFEALGDPESRLFPVKQNDRDPLLRAFPSLHRTSAHVGDLYEFKDHLLLADLTRAAILRATLSKRQLFEVMVQFWTDHFNIDPSKGECKWLKPADDRDVIRKHALGKFPELVRASALSPAMLWYLDGRVNERKALDDKPNENYARELLELHTLGVHGGYTQQDVMEVARCLTGWTARDKKRWRKGSVEFNARAHDDGEKIVLGERIPAGLGASDLDRVLTIVALHPSTARHLATKLCKRFIADDPAESAIAATARAFSQSGGDIRATLRALFSTPEFMAARGTKLKRPFHFVVSALRAANAETDGGKPIIEALLRMGHAPFRFPTPDGYPEEASHWRSTLLWRWNFAAALAANKLPGTRVALDALREKLGGDSALLATALGRQPNDHELAAWRDSGAGFAVLLASPGFQKC
jgi:uncharacterized protein (DUF1800 family)